jgi:hypothetical protein
MPDRSRMMTQTKKGYPATPGWGFGLGLATPHSKKKLIVAKVEQRKAQIDLHSRTGRDET